MGKNALRASAAALLFVPAAALAHAMSGAPHGWQDWLGRFHPGLVHFPVTLLIFAFVAEMCCVATRDGRYSDIARFLVNMAAWISIPAAVTGFLRSGSITMDAAEQHLFAIHRIAGIATPVLAFLCAGLGEGVRRSGQIWELMLYRVVLGMAAVSAGVAGYYGGEIVFGAGFFPLW
jgi:uncharacterized membrane protein